MPTVTLKRPASLTKLGQRFERKKETPVPLRIAKALEDDDRFTVVIEADAKDEPETDTGTVDTRPSKKSDRLVAISEAIGKLDPEKDFTGDGKPDARALTSLLGWQVTAKERDEAVAASAEPTEDAETETPTGNDPAGGGEGTDQVKDDEEGTPVEGTETDKPEGAGEAPKGKVTIVRKNPDPSTDGAKEV